ncbi:phasin family protein [Spartinivicinus ruber]|uniref:phasin family protein n=1 Tax=Spartinivicinus ruber TaxID=2683272 RepID=UPI0013D05A3D|nr:phasin family protein [Spartinivicinus ruber]
MELVKDSGFQLGQLKNAAHKIWLAGLGAFVQLEKAGQESQRLFDHLVEEGEKLEQRLHEQHDKAAHEKPTESTQHPLSSKQEQSENPEDLRTLLNRLSNELTQLTAMVKEMQSDCQTTKPDKSHITIPHTPNKRKHRGKH